ncbi:MAG: cation diffusion facilitator family transporter [Omnitrophica WOR_2 bacterium GWF2_38_59]|nr:MAG: cation diffusion facilitator family transporter [Omnitrophica WOR_2 bacterium GWF2_38_59]OGX46980.1 MAG: cation diffusion facilitator family transporter [Omnitrophica WOR_2 bacterium RIFOXYA2_FULL_38_17]OGX55228.1 MAG: cation diffusion facilitator family transporter [Omnitrophica WOR_2 bacterium RIFOXYC2_FULL_38_12]OGX57672.1 MAG: cation diffusion facilitator family transporter [Omnitrophica WOR_2 bacterium RIFOXYB2_FULL_38_16]
MHTDDLKNWKHLHTFGQDKKRSGELRTALVIGFTGVTMFVEIVAGFVFGSMALLADGLHMASHATALIINLYAYVYARRHANDRRYSFGTGKVNSLGGFTGAILLAVFALMMAWGSVERIFNPVSIAFNQAIFVATVGLIINGLSVLILEQKSEHDEHGHEHHHDHNLRSAYLHVLADALTSVLAIAALLMAKYFGLIWIDPVIGMLGSLLVFRWSVGLLRTASSVLLDRQGDNEVVEKIKKSIECVSDNRVSDIHLWIVGPNMFSTIISVVSSEPQQPDYYKELLPKNIGLEHVSIEVHKCTNRNKE